jgi:Flp pilus assembly protein TadD/septal ring factor EnvC (AmiA/AmiB activator)
MHVRAQGSDAAQQQFVEAFLGVRKAEEQEKSGDARMALATYKTALGTLMRIKQENPKWQTELLDFRIAHTLKAIERIEGASPAMMKAPGNDLGLPLIDPNSGAVNRTGPQTGIPKGRPTTTVDSAPVPGADPIEALKQQMQDLRNRLAKAEETIREEQDKNSKLAADFAEAIDSQKKAEAAQKKAQQLAEVLQASMHDLKTVGEENGARAKDLEAKLAVAKRSEADTRAELEAAEERVEQLRSRSKKMTEVAATASTLPKQVDTLKAKLDAEQKATAQQAEAAKKREEDLKSQIAALAKDKAESAAAVAEMKSLQAKLDAETKTSASEAMKAKKREEDLKTQIATLTKEKKDQQEELVRLRELNKSTDKLMADNTNLLKKLGDLEKQIATYKAGDNRDSELAMLRKQISDTQKALVSSDQKNTAMQVEITELQKKVTDYSKQIAEFKADKKASAEERKKMEDENKLLQGIVMRVLQEDANRSQRKKMIQAEVGKLHIQSDALLRQISYLSQPVVQLSAKERKLFKKPVIEVQDVNTLVAVKTDGAPPPADPSAPANPTEPPKTGTETPDTTPLPKPPEPGGTATPESPKPTPEPPKTEPAKNDTQPSTAKTKTPNDGLPEKDPADTKPAATKQTDTKPSSTKSTDGGTSPSGSAGAAAKLPPEVRAIADQAKKAFDSEKFSEAERLYDKTLQVAPNNVFLLSNTAVVQYRQGKYKQAEATFKKALAIAPEDAFCWSTIGIVYYQEEKFDDAVNALTKSLAINQRNPTAHNYLGITAAHKGWLEAAQKELESAVQLDPKYGDAWYNLAITLASKTPPDKEDARKAYEKALELGVPKSDEMEKLLAK